MSKTLDRIVSRIEDGTCLLILGPELLEGDASLNVKLNHYLKEIYGDRISFYEQEEFLKIRNRLRLEAEDDIRAFYDQLKPNEIYRKLAQIPFSVIINTSPDKVLNMAMNEQKIAYTFDYYHKNELSQTTPESTDRLIYNIFGSSDDVESMILTFDDLCDFFTNLIGSSNLTIEPVLRTTKSVLFLGFRFDKWYSKLLIKLIPILNEKLLHANNIDQPSVKNFYTEEFEMDFFEQSAADIVDKIHEEVAERGLITEPAVAVQKELFISYAWGGESEAIVDRMDVVFQQNGILMIRDKRDLQFNESIREFMRQIGAGKAIVVVISDKYLKSPNCMFELLEIYQNKEFVNRIFPIILEDAAIFDPFSRIKYWEYWKEKKDQLDQLFKKHGAKAYAMLGEDFESYENIFNNFGQISNLLKDINVLTPAMHLSKDFEQLMTSIRNYLDN
ncbi:MAG: toll/interleukin-1 receptor domain-containing protein [Bacteroidota bacterium]